MRGFLLVFDRSSLCQKCRVNRGSAVVRAGLALVFREYPWIFHGYTLRYNSEGTRFKVAKQHQKFKLALERFKWILLVEDEGSGKKRGGRVRQVVAQHSAVWMADSPCMKNRSLKAGGRLNRWSFKAGFTVQFRCCRNILDLVVNKHASITVNVGLVMHLWLCLTVSHVRSTHDHCMRQASGLTCDSDVMEKLSRRWWGAVQQIADFFFEKVSFRATAPAPIIVRATFSWPIYSLFLFTSSGNCLKNVAIDFFLFLSYDYWRWNKVRLRWKTPGFVRFEDFGKLTFELWFSVATFCR